MLYVETGLPAINTTRPCRHQQFKSLVVIPLLFPRVSNSSSSSSTFQDYRGQWEIGGGLRSTRWDVNFESRTFIADITGQVLNS